MRRRTEQYPLAQQAASLNRCGKREEIGSWIHQCKDVVESHVVDPADASYGSLGQALHCLPGAA